MESAVIYARFSSYGQNEQSIEAQVRICTEFAENKGLKVIQTYSDKAKTGTNDARPAFQRMLRDARTGAFQYVIVYMFDRFARNRRDSIVCKEMLKDNGVKVLSALEPIADDEGGEFYEMFLEWNAEKYSKRLSKRVKDGLDTSVANGTFCGGHLIYGYRKRLEPVQGKSDRFIKYIEIVPEEAEILQYAFEQFDKGVSKTEIAEALNAKGLRFKGKPFTNKTFDRYFTNRKYTGEFEFGERLCDNMYPKIIEKDVFERVQERLEKSRYKGAIHKALEPYILTGKLICGHCKTPMVSDGGTNRDGSRRYYYACKKMKKHACNKKRVEKDAMEFDVTVFVKNFYSDPKNAEKAAEATIAYFEKRTDNENLISIKNKIANVTKEAEKLTDSFINANSVLLRNNIEKKMAEYETLLNDLQAQEAQIELERGLQMTKQDILDFIAELMTGDPHDKKYQKRLIDNLVKRVVVRDDGFSVVTTLKGSPKFYADDPEVVESEIERLRELLELENELKPPKKAYLSHKAEQIRTPPPRHSNAHPKRVRIGVKRNMRISTGRKEWNSIVKKKK